MRLEHTTFEEGGVRLTLYNEKTARSSRPSYPAIPHTRSHRFCMPCTLQTLVDALNARGIMVGPLFPRIDRWGNVHARPMAPKSITNILRSGLKRAGLVDADTYSSHSFRHGVVVTAQRKGWTDKNIMLITMHRSRAGLEPYFAGLDVWERSPKSTVLEDDYPSDVTSGQGWRHVERP
jgi:hypothetical protein